MEEKEVRTREIVNQGGATAKEKRAKIRNLMISWHTAAEEEGQIEATVAKEDREAVPEPVRTHNPGEAHSQMEAPRKRTTEKNKVRSEVNPEDDPEEEEEER